MKNTSDQPTDASASLAQTADNNPKRSSNQHGEPNLPSGLEALRESPEFRGPFEPLNDHNHANDHFALLYENRIDQLAAVVPFIRQGLEQGERCLYIADDNSKAEVVETMRARGIDVDAVLESGALSIHTKQETYLRTGTFDRDAMLEFWKNALKQAKDADGYGGIRAAAEMTWALDGNTSLDSLVEYEATLNLLFQDEDYTVLCQYNRERFPPEVLEDVIRTHPHLIHNRMVSPNVYYTPPEEFFRPGQPADKVDRMLETLRDRTRAKTEVQRTKEHFKRVFESSHDAILIVDPEANKIIDANPAASKMLGYSRDELLSCAPSDLHPDELDRFYGFVDEVFEDGSGWTDELTCHTKDRGRILVEISASRIEFDDRPVMLAAVRDISERKKHEQTQRRLYEIAADSDRTFNEKIQAVFELGCDRFNLEYGGIARVDPATDLFKVEMMSGDHKYLIPGQQCPLSETYCRLVTNDEKTASVTDPVSEGFKDKMCFEQFGVQTYIGTHLELDSGADRTFFFVSSNPREEFSDEERTFHHLMGQWVAYELEQDRTHSELQESKDQLVAQVADMERLHNLNTRLLRQNNTKAALREVMEASAELLQADKASVQIYDEESEIFRLVGSLGFDEAFHEQFKGVELSNFTSCAAAMGRREEILVEDLSADPEFADFYQAARPYGLQAAFSTPLYGSDQQLLGMFTMYWNEPHRPAEDELKLLDLYTQQAARQIERRRAEDQLRSAKKEAEKTARLRSNLLANVSHEIRTPITGILGLAEGLEEKVTDERREEVQLIETCGTRLMNTLDSVLALAQLEGGEIDVETKRLDLLAEVKEIAASLQPLASDKGLTFEVVSETAAAKAEVDPALLDRIVNNLVNNAIKFTDDGGITIKVTASEQNVSIAVSDTGVGISKEFQKRLFDEFTQESTGFSRDYEGVGLGLPLTKRMTEQMSGGISVESEKGQGSTFTVSFPRVTSGSEVSAEGVEDRHIEGLNDTMETEQATSILLIEDNKIIRRVIVERLGERHGYQVEAFERAEPALARAKEQAFDVVLIDISLPGIDGTAALQQLRATKTYRARPIIAVTGHALPGDRERFLEEGFSEHMGKPFSADQLAETIRSLES